MPKTKKKSASYVWIILGVLVVGVILYFGLPSSEKECVFAEEVECLEYSVTEEEISLVLKNNLGEAMHLDKIRAERCRGPAIIANTVQDSEEFTVTISDCWNLIDEGYTDTFNLSYTDIYGYLQSLSGSINTLIE